MAKEDYKGIWVFAEQQNGTLNPVTYELLAKAQELKAHNGEAITAVLLGSKVAHLAAGLIAGGMVTAVTLGAAAVHCRVYQAIVAQEVKKALKPVNARLDALQATVDAVAEAEGVAPDKAHKSKKHSR